ncbi:MAG: hypothetical protein AAFZ17_02630 [Cyanobacteria bacterium J06650_10]
MSDNSAPEVLGLLDIDVPGVLTGILDSTNLIDTYSFTIPEVVAVPDSGEAVFDVGSLFTATTGSGAPLTVTIGQDLNGNGAFDPGSETIASLTVGNGDSLSLPLDFRPSPFDVFDVNNAFLPGETYFASIQTSVAGDVASYSVEAQLRGGIIGEITNSDDCYTCDGARYYYDEYTDDLIGQEVRVGVDDLEAGDSLNISLYASEFDPVLLLFNVETGEVIESATTTGTLSLGGQDYRATSINFTLQDGITYGVSVETLGAGDTGSYVVTGEF